MATFTGNSSSESLSGGAGNDLLYGGAGNDTVFGGAGDDTIYGGADGAVTANYVSVNGANQTVTGTAGRANFTASSVSADGDLTAYNFYGVNGVWIGNGDSTEGHTHTMSTAVAGARIPFNAVNTSDVFSISLDGVSVNLNTAIANGTVTLNGASAYGINATGGIIGLANGNALATGTLTINVPFTKIGFSNTGSGNGTVYDLQVDTNPLSGIAAGGDDALYGGDGNDVIYTETGNDTVDGGAGNDTVDGGTGRDSVAGGAGDDSLSGGADNDTMSGDAGKDQLFGGSGADALFGGEGDDRLDGGTEGDALYGGLGKDQLIGGSGADSLFGGDDSDSLYGGSENDALSGDAGNDLLDGGSGNDTFDGGLGNDTLIGGAGADVLIGGDGADAIDYSASGSGVSVNFFSGTGLGGDAEGDRFGSIEGVTGSAYADTLTGSGNADNFSAGAGSDLGFGGSGADSLFGGVGNDTFYGGADADQMSGDSGADFLIGDDGADTLDGGDGDDTLHGGQGNDQNYGGAGNDLLYSSQGDDLLDGGKGNDSFFVSEGSGYQKIIGGDEGGDTDTLAFSSKSQGVSVTFNGDEGGYYRQGGIASDGKSAQILTEKEQIAQSEAVAVEAKAESVIDAKSDQLAWGEGSSGAFSQIERVAGTEFDDNVDASSTKEGVTVEGGAGQDSLLGGHGSDQLFGGEGNDQLFGGEAEDYLSGGAGDDLLRGGAGADKLEGGKGRDTFQLELVDSDDVIVDFDMNAEKEGPTTDQLDVSELTDREGNPVKAWDVKVEGFDGGTVLHFPFGEHVTLMGVSAEQVLVPGTLHAMGVPCFVSGTRILTPSGARPVESIVVGDLVVTAAGQAVPVLWHGRRNLKAADLLSNPHLRPIRLRAGSYGCQRDLLLSAQHGVRVTGPDGDCLVRAGHLIGKGARLALGLREVCYHHLLLPAHAIILAEGAPVESFYPGKMAVAALELGDQIDLFRTISDLNPHITTGAALDRYGPRCLPLLSRKQAMLVLAGIDRAKSNGNRGVPARAFYDGAHNVQ
ncbi:MAG: Hint domain-containing protein [Microgenomates group bacterium]